jgi:hypothetical protein
VSAMINPKEIAREHRFDTVTVTWTERGYWTVWVHGIDVGPEQCSRGCGNDPDQALADVLRKVRIYREDEALRAIAGKDARSRKIAALKAELASLAGDDQ